MRRFSALALSVLLATAFAACGDDTGNGDPPVQKSYGEVCVPGECASGICLAIGADAKCSADCSVQPCPNGDECVSAGGQKVCKVGFKPPAVCGDSKCEGNESCRNCEKDCG